MKNFHSGRQFGESYNASGSELLAYVHVKHKENIIVMLASDLLLVLVYVGTG